MAVAYENIFYDYVMSPMRNLLFDEFNYGKIYIAPNILHLDNFSIRIWGDSIETVETLSSTWQKQYNLGISLYCIEKNPQENFYKQFYGDIERIYQLLFDNCKVVATTSDSITHTWIDGVCESFLINDFEEGEEEVEGLNVCKFNFNCKVMRHS
ncbi:MAG: hypothetical protein Unbinned4234contig1003_25 [Prokaryotic dsDNA virus sp.]|nr:MAG: hypothetical protein Unbinned4234contig1003_25 [Prokaryotic dsDNA virus sp.]